MSNSFGQEGPNVPHLVTDGKRGLAGEIGDLRSDVENAFTSIEAALINGSLKVNLDPAQTVSGTNDAIVGLQVEDGFGNPVAGVVQLQFLAFSDDKLLTLATVVMASPTAGDILQGATNALVVETDANGRFQCTLTNAADTVIHMACDESVGSPALNCTDRGPVTFTV